MNIHEYIETLVDSQLDFIFDESEQPFDHSRVIPTPVLDAVVQGFLEQSEKDEPTKEGMKRRFPAMKNRIPNWRSPVLKAVMREMIRRYRAREEAAKQTALELKGMK